MIDIVGATVAVAVCRSEKGAKTATQRAEASRSGWLCALCGADPVDPGTLGAGPNGGGLRGGVLRRGALRGGSQGSRAWVRGLRGLR